MLKALLIRFSSQKRVLGAASKTAKSVVRPWEYKGLRWVYGRLPIERNIWEWEFFVKIGSLEMWK